MAKFQAAHWGETGIEVYELGNGHAHRLFSGPVEAMEPFRGWPKRRVLVIGRGNFIRVRKRYPPAKIDTLRRAVAVEAPDLFPIPNPGLHCRIHETFATHVVLDVWAWEQGPLDQLRKAFPFRYIIPEDLAFLSLPPVIHIYRSGSMIHLLACGGGRFFDAVSCRAADFSAEVMEKFRAGLAGNASVISETRIYGELPGVTDSAAPLVTRVPGNGHPPCLDALAEPAFAFRAFRFAGGGVPLPHRSMIFRFAIYAVLACGVSLFVTMNNYDHALQDSQTLSRTLDKEIALLESYGGKGQGELEALSEFQEKVKGDMAPVRILDVLASGLPQGSHVKSLSLNDGAVEAVVLSRDPLSVIRHLESNQRVGKLSLKGSPAQDAATGAYSCTLRVEIKP
jgi:hypothetical protein